MSQILISFLKVPTVQSYPRPFVIIFQKLFPSSFFPNIFSKYFPTLIDLFPHPNNVSSVVNEVVWMQGDKLVSIY